MKKKYEKGREMEKALAICYCEKNTNLKTNAINPLTVYGSDRTTRANHVVRPVPSSRSGK